MIEPITYLNVKQVARIFGVSERLIYKLANSGSMPHIRIGKRIVIAETDVQNYINNNQHPMKVEK